MNDQDGGTSELTPQSRLGYANIDFVDDGDAVICMWTGTAWAVLAPTKLLLIWVSLTYPNLVDCEYLNIGRGLTLSF